MQLTLSTNTRVLEITPFVPLILRGRFEESSYFRGERY